jgi:hypothetical protein
MMECTHHGYSTRVDAERRLPSHFPPESHRVLQAVRRRQRPMRKLRPQMVAAPPEFTSPTSPSPAHRTVPHVDGATWPCHLRVAPSRTSPDSAIKSQDPSFEGPAPRDRLLRRGIIPPGRVGKRRAGFTRRLLALRIARLSSGRGLASPPYPPPMRTATCRYI